VLLLLAVALGFTLSALDPRAAEQTPWHDHVVIGAHGLEEWAHALVVHRHEAERRVERAEARPAPARPALSHAQGPHVLSIGRALDGTGASVFDTSGLLLADSGDPADGLRPRGSGSRPQPVVRLLSPIPVPVPELPPRALS
jgi:hypothetical protein